MKRAKSLWVWMEDQQVTEVVGGGCGDGDDRRWW